MIIHNNMLLLKEFRRVPGSVMIWKSSFSSLLASRSTGSVVLVGTKNTNRFWSYCRNDSLAATISSCSSSLSVTKSIRNDQNHFITSSSSSSYNNMMGHHHYLYNTNHQQQLLRYYNSTTIIPTTTTTVDNKESYNNQEQSFIIKKDDNNNKVEERIRRCLFSVPGSKMKMIQKAITLINVVDSIVYDLEDGVPYNEKDIARKLIYETLNNMNNDDYNTNNNEQKRSEICIRINALDTPYYYEDLLTLIPCTKLQTVVIPKVESLSDLITIHDIIKDILISSSSQHRDIRLLAAIESARGIINLHEIAKFNDHIASLNIKQQEKQQQHDNNNITISLDGLIFASEDYCANIEAIRTESGTELLYARSQLVTYAKAYQLQAIDMVHINFRNINALQIECYNGKELGYNGKQAIHPNQINIIQQTFIPSNNDIIFAKQCIELFHGTPIEINGIVVDIPVYKWAIKIINRAKAAGILDT